MPDSPANDPLAVLDARARPRTRLAVGAAVTLFIVAVAVAAVVSFVGGGGGAQGVVGPQGGVGEGSGGGSSVSSTGVDAAAAGVDGGAPLLVHVLGAVLEPGLVELAPGSRVVDAVAAAGGFTAEADPAGVNLARAVVDGEQLVVPAVGQVPATGTGAPAAGGGAPSDGKVHLNTADLAELDTLPRIGPALAQRIIDWREANGPFTSVDQLLDVAGIGDAVYSGLVDLVSP